MVEPGEQISSTLKKEFMEEALAGLDMDETEREELKRQVDALFQLGIEVNRSIVNWNFYRSQLANIQKNCQKNV